MKGKKGNARLTASLSGLSVELGSERTPPTAFRIFKVGDNPSEKGTFIFDEASALSVMKEFVAHGKPLLLDYNHGTLLEGGAPEASISAGEGVPEVRDGELWLTGIKWTDRAASLLSAGEYRLFSPYFNHDKEGRVTRLINVALTNLPALDDIEPLVAASANPNNEDDMACESCSTLTARLTAKDEELSALRARLSMFEKSDKDKDEQCSALKARVTTLEKAAVDETTKATALTAITGKLTALTGDSSEAAALGTVTGWQTKALAYDKLAADVAEKEAVALRAELTGALDGGVKELKVPPAERESLEKAALAFGGGKPSKDGVAWLSANITARTKVVSGQEIVQERGGSPNVSPEDAKMNRLMGIDQEAFAKHQADQAAARK